jgi:hypothetical protein
MSDYSWGALDGKGTIVPALLLDTVEFSLESQEGKKKKEEEGTVGRASRPNGIPNKAKI